MTRTPTIYAHRGVNALAPENSLKAFKLCIDFKVDWIECDVRILKNDLFILSHDLNLIRTSGIDVNLSDLSLEELKEIKLLSIDSNGFDKETIPTLKEFLSFLSGTNLNINFELKFYKKGVPPSESLVKSFLKEISPLIDNHAIILSSFNHELIFIAKLLAPNLKTAILLSEKQFKAGVDWKKVLNKTNSEHINIEDTIASQTLVYEMLAESVEVNVWTVNTLKRATELFGWGVCGIFTDSLEILDAARDGKFNNALI